MSRCSVSRKSPSGKCDQVTGLAGCWSIAATTPARTPSSWMPLPGAMTLACPTSRAQVYLQGLRSPRSRRQAAVREGIDAQLMPWSAPFEDPIPRPNGRSLVTLSDAANYIMKLPKSEHLAPEWQTAMEVLLLVAESGGPTIILPATSATTPPITSRAWPRWYPKEAAASAHARKSRRWGTATAFYALLP